MVEKGPINPLPSHRNYDLRGEKLEGESADLDILQLPDLLILFPRVTGTPERVLLSVPKAYSFLTTNIVSDPLPHHIYLPIRIGYHDLKANPYSNEPGYIWRSGTQQIYMSTTFRSGIIICEWLIDIPKLP